MALLPTAAKQDGAFYDMLHNITIQVLSYAKKFSGSVIFIPKMLASND